MPLFAPAQYKILYGIDQEDYLGKRLISADLTRIIEVSEERANQIFRKQDQWAEILEDRKTIFDIGKIK